MKRLGIGLFRRRRSEIGTALLEATVGSLVLAIIGLGCAEYGMLYGRALDLSNAVRAGSAAGAIAGNDGAADVKVIKAVLNSRGTSSRDIEHVVIYKINTGPSGELQVEDSPWECGAGKVCNSYRFAPNALVGVNESQLDAKVIQGRETYGWNESTRVPGSDFLGVWVKMRRPSVQKLVPSPHTLQDKHVSVLSPPVSPTTGISLPNDFEQSANVPIGTVKREDYVGWGHYSGDDSGGGGSGGTGGT